MLEECALTVPSIQCNLPCTLVFAQRVGAVAVAKAVMRPLIVTQQLLGITQKVVPVMSGTWDLQ